MFEEKKQENNAAPRRPLFAAEPTPARRLAEGAMLVAVAVIFGISAAYLPFVWLIALFLWPVPLALLVRRFGLGFGLAGLLAATVILAIFIGPLGALAMLLAMGGVGVWYGYAARRGCAPWLILVVGVMLSALGMAALLLLSSAVSGLGWADFSAQVHEFVGFYVDTMQKNGNLDALLGSMTAAEFAAALERQVISLLPASLIMMSMLAAGIAYALNVYIFRRLGYQVQKLPPFPEWRLPWYTLWGLIVALAAYLLGRQMEVSLLIALANNLLYIYQPLLMLAGLSFFYWQVFFWNVRWLLFFILVLVIFAFQIIAPVLMLVGLADSLFDLRKIMRRFAEKQGW